MMFQRELPPSWRSYQRTLQATNRARRRQRLDAIAGMCVIVVLATFAAALTYGVAMMVIR